jgi:3-phenylpropionate/trans-cinnamate dioxygenase ferredoxin reductase subunit
VAHVADTSPGVTIVGGGVAGASLISRLRRHGLNVPLRLIDAQSHLPYDRPPLSKQVLETGDPTCPVFRDEAFYEQNNVELMLGRTVCDVDTRTRSVVLDGCEHVSYEVLVLAVGLEARPLQISGSDLGGVHVLRSFDDALAIRDSLARAGHVLVIGAGFIGAELASAARSRELSVTVVEIGSQPMARLLDPRLGAVCATLMIDNGVALRTATAVLELQGSGRVEAAVLSDGTTLAVDTVVVGVGTQLPAVLIDGEPIRGLGLEVDASYRTEYADVYAVGDIAVQPGMRRAEQWTNAIEATETVARAIVTGAPLPPSVSVPYGWSQQFGRMVQVAGDLTAAERMVTFNNDGRRLTLTGDAIVRGAFALDHGKALMHARRLIGERVPWKEGVAQIGALGLGEPRSEAEALAHQGPQNSCTKRDIGKKNWIQARKTLETQTSMAHSCYSREMEEGCRPRAGR